jgi:Tol biopolymer transport system component
MGEVYRARDPRLGREVAVKVLPASFSSDPDRMRRFEQEARAAGILNHPNITAVYDVGTLDGSPYVVTELLEGETLRSRLGGGALAPRRAIDYAIQVAHGLAAAHEKGIVHRDLKPENLFVTKDGRLKILDFGLAKLTQPEKGGPHTNLPTETAGTEPGVVLGTLVYMSPEQVRGRAADARSDIFSFGAILYEMLTGKRAFHGDSAADTMSAILREDPPDLSSTNRLIAPALDRIVRHCLEKDPEARFHSAHDLAFDLAALSGTQPGESQVAPVVAGRRPRPTTVALVALAGVALALAAALVFLPNRRPARESATPLGRFALAIPPGTTYSPAEISRGLSISPDGTRVVLESLVKGRSQLYLRSLASEKAVPLEGTAGANAPFWSPDSRFIAFFADGKLKKVPASGGPAEDLCDALFGWVGTWSPQGTILFAQLPPGLPGILRVSDKGGQATRIVAPDPGLPLWPHFLPDGRRFLYLALRAQGASSVDQFSARELRIASLESKESRVVGRLDSRFEYAPPGYLLYVRGGNLFAQPFDEKRAAFSGEPVALAENVHYFFGPANASFSVSQTGVVAYQTAPLPLRLVWFDRQGATLGVLGQPSVVEGLRISPDGRRVAVDIGDLRTGTSDLWVFELSSGVSTRLHADAIDEILPVWSPDGVKLLFRSDRKGPPDIHEITVGQPGSERSTLEQPGVQQAEDVSFDGRMLVYLNDVRTIADIWLLTLTGERKPSPWIRSTFNERNPRFSPDGRWIAYNSDESGDAEIYVALTEGGGEKKRLSPAGGRKPRWRRDGKELYYVAPDGTVMAVPITLGPRLESGAPTPLFRVETDVENYDVVPDGSRFLVSTRLEKSPESPLRVIVNWDGALKETK